MTMRQVTIPFSGFYNSFHDSALDSALELRHIVDSGDIDFDALDEESGKIRWKYVHTKYVEAYAGVIADECQLPGLTFARLQSPREYNFGTDLIICNVPESTILDIWARCGKVTLSALVAERLAVRSGFIPFYSDSLSDWDDSPLDWDDAQLDLLIESWCNEWESAEWRDCYAMESFECNGYFESWIEESQS